MQAQREFAYSQMVIKPSFPRSGRETRADSQEIQEARHFLISFLQLAAQLMWNKKKDIYLEITMCLNLVR